VKIKLLHIRPFRAPGIRRSIRNADERRLGAERPQRLYSLLLPPTRER
jgi:hypothetical protein